MPRIFDNIELGLFPTLRETLEVASRSVWLRRGDPSVPNPSGVWRDLTLSVIGNAAARETFVTATPHMAAIWTDLFGSMIAPGSELRWRGDGPGIGRDARIAYSSLLGRYMARAYLTEHERVRVLVPLDVAKCWLRETDSEYEIGKDPQSRGLEADWIGIDADGLLIVEAKGSFDDGLKTWCGPHSRPQILKTAIAQAKRTAVFVRHPRRKLPAKRWAIASRWGTEENKCVPTLLAWDHEDEKLGKDDYQTLAKILLRADLDGVMRGLGYLGIEQVLGAAQPPQRVPGELQIRVGDQDIEPGIAAIVGPFGVQPLRSKQDLLQVSQILQVLQSLDLNLNNNIAVASLSSRYVTTVSQERLWTDEAETANELSANRGGLTVVWPKTVEDLVLGEE